MRLRSRAARERAQIKRLLVLLHRKVDRIDMSTYDDFKVALSDLDRLGEDLVNVPFEAARTVAEDDIAVIKWVAAAIRDHLAAHDQPAPTFSASTGSIPSPVSGPQPVVGEEPVPPEEQHATDADGNITTG